MNKENLINVTNETDLTEVYYRHYVNECGDFIGECVKPIDLLLEKIDNEELASKIHEEVINQLCIARDYFTVDGMLLAERIGKN